MRQTLRNSLRIAQLNDVARTALGVASCVLQTPGIAALPPAVQSRIREAVERFDDWTPDNDPFGEHDFGGFDVDDVGRVFWKIDYYDRALHGSEDPADPAVTRRVLTIMLAEEY